MDRELAMAGALRKTMVYLGLAEDERYDEEAYEEYDDAPGDLHGMKLLAHLRVSPKVRVVQSCTDACPGAICNPCAVP